MSFNDEKYRVTSGDELAWLLTQIEAIPAVATATNIPDAWKEWLTGLGYSGGLQDMQKAWLVVLGYTKKSIQDNLYDYYKAS